MKKVFSTLALFLFVSLSAFAQTNEAYKDALTKMFQISGTEQTYQAAIEQMFIMFKGQYPETSEEMWKELEGEFQQTSMGDLVELLVPVYQKHLTLSDVNGLIAFYETEVGKKFASKTPFIMKESMQVGQQWGMKIGQDFAEKMKKKGY